MSWILLGESVIGTSHRRQNTPCQDAFRFRRFGPSEEWLVVCLADGAGSASHAEVGAALACDEFVRRVEALSLDVVFTRERMTALFTEVRSAILTEAERQRVPARELASTALLAILSPTWVALAQVGDGAIILGDGQAYGTAFWPEPAEYANATDFLTDDRFADVLQFVVTTGPTSEIALLSDGLQRLALDFVARSAHLPFFRPLFADVRAAPDPELLTEPLRAFLDSPRVNERTDDDKTLVIAVRRP